MVYGCAYTLWTPNNLLLFTPGTSYDVVNVCASRTICISISSLQNQWLARLPDAPTCNLVMMQGCHRWPCQSFAALDCTGLEQSKCVHMHWGAHSLRLQTMSLKQTVSSEQSSFGACFCGTVHVHEQTFLRWPWDFVYTRNFSSIANGKLEISHSVTRSPHLLTLTMPWMTVAQVTKLSIAQKE